MTTTAPLIVEDAREHPLVQDNHAIADLGVIAYAGMPLTDADGHVLGSLCAIDTRPRTWTPTEITVRLLLGHDHLFGFGSFRHLPRHDHHVDLEPGSTLFFYSDGLIERRGHDLDHGLDHLLDLLAANRHLSNAEIVEITVDKLAADSPDDVVAFAIHIPTVDQGDAQA